MSAIAVACQGKPGSNRHAGLAIPGLAASRNSATARSAGAAILAAR